MTTKIHWILVISFFFFFTFLFLSISFLFVICCLRNLCWNHCDRYFFSVSLSHSIFEISIVFVCESSMWLILRRFGCLLLFYFFLFFEFFFQFNLHVCSSYSSKLGSNVIGYLFRAFQFLIGLAKHLVRSCFGCSAIDVNTFAMVYT